MSDAPALGVLHRILERPDEARPGERCELCRAEVGEEHGHVVDLESRGLQCACRPCWLLFTQPGAAQGRYKGVPDRVLAYEGFDLAPGAWDRLQIPVNLAFFFQNSRQERTVALYPSPAGATESLLELDAWDEVIRANPALGDVETDVEAALVRNRDGRFECYVVPIDACYELVGHLRRLWKGFDGGREAKDQIEAFFADIHRRSRPVGANR